MRKGLRVTAGAVTMALVLGIGIAALPSTSAVAASASPTVSVTEHYDGQTFALTPGNWHGASECAIVNTTNAYCFSTNAEFRGIYQYPSECQWYCDFRQYGQPRYKWSLQWLGKDLERYQLDRYRIGLRGLWISAVPRRLRLCSVHSQVLVH